mmetsp:Transcript_35874/g.36327  ORF Transcript_35874/g.36327 Transcript_35874/m.36327 type:complete len:167 (+) Transcript_35874:96-596(+)
MINDIDTDDNGMDSIIDSSNKIIRRRTGTTSEVDDYCYSRNYKHKHNRSFLRYYSSALEIINEEEHQQQQQQSQWSEDKDEDENENETADSHDDDDDTFSPSFFVPRMTTTTDFCLSQRRMKKSHSVSSSLSSLFLLEEEEKQDHNRIHHVPVHNGTGLHYTAKSA